MSNRSFKLYLPGTCEHESNMKTLKNNVCIVILQMDLSIRLSILTRLEHVPPFLQGFGSQGLKLHTPTAVTNSVTVSLYPLDQF